jgi:hypothetical protein
VRPERAHHAHHVAEHRVARPVPERLLGALAEPEVEGAREVLAAPVQPPRREQLLGADGA